MARGELLLELLSEEIPARMQRRAIEDFSALVRDKLKAAEIPATKVRGYVTPRRLAVIADGVPERQPDRSEERRGPRVGAPQQALDGFLRAAGLASIEQCEVRDTGRGEFYFTVIQSAGRPAAEVLPGLLQAAIAELPWPKSMRFPAAPLRWVRPLTSVLCMFEGEVLPLALGEVPVGNTTRGHRFLSPGEIAVADSADYVAKLEAAHVVLDQDRRRELIAADLERLAKAEGLGVKPDPGLLDEVTGLAEFPVVLIGKIDDEFVRPLPEGLPPEVLATAMRTHQKYFSCLKSDGSPASRFLFVANNKTPDGGKTIVAGNERVLRARLADARFFWDQDRKIPLADRVDALKDRVYYEKLGTVYDKVRHMEKLAGFLVPYVPGADAERARRAALLAKADLSTGMVGEFPELQGVMGRYYARNDGEDARVADAIADHYKPLGPNDICPTAPDSIVVALADKLDALAAFFAIGEKPTGSRDPFALRRAAQGIIRIILENDLRLPLRGPFIAAAELIPVAFQRVMEEHEIAGELIGFVFERLRVHVREQGISHDLIEAARRAGRVVPDATSRSLVQEDDLTRFMRRVRALQEFLATDDGANLLIAYRRASNIVSIEEKRDACSYGGAVKRAEFRRPEETELERCLREVSNDAPRALEREGFEAAMQSLARLRGPVDEFFDKVTVNVDDKALRENRLRLLSRIRAVMNQVADFSQIEG